jgi:hypothetical protein
MRSSILLAALMVVTAVPSSAQQRVRAASTLWGAVGIYNATGTSRISGPLDVVAGREIIGDVAVLNGPVVVSGRITGSLVAINADVRLKAGSRIDEDVIIVGGVLTRDDSVTIGGEVRTQAELLRYTLDGERLVPEEDRTSDWRPRMDRPGKDRGESYTDLFFVAARTYNRVEGLPVMIGPRFRRPTDWGRFEVEALGVVRTAGPVRWDRGTLGHDAKFDLRLGVRNGLVLGGRAFDVVAPVESWQLTDTEAGLATFVLHRDMRDYSGRHGWEASLGGRLGEEASLSFVAGSEQWRSVEERRPFTLSRDTQRWRVNAPMDVGRVDLASMRLRIDTRERVRAPWLGGWYVNADVERGSGTIVRDPGPALLAGPAEDVTYTRGFFDGRRYNRLSPGTELNLRIVAGGWLGGDQLPLQRRLSMGGPGSVEGYDFRRNWYDADDLFTCGGIADWVGRPALCDRIALAQIELRQTLDWHWYRNGEKWLRLRDLTPAWVIFADAGRGWSTPATADPVSHGNGLPPLSSFRTSIGVGLDLGDIGVYLAKSVSTPKEAVNVIVRMGRRF